MNKKIISLILASVSFCSNLKQISYAKLPQSVLINTTREIEGALDRRSEIKRLFKNQNELKEGKLSEQEIRNSINKMFENASEKTDIQYILDALNLLDPYIYNLTGTTKNFRFYDGYKQEISTTSALTWDYKKDKGEGSPNFVRCLFPSSAGTLSETGGLDSVENFTKDCTPTPKLIAQIVGYIHNHIRTLDPVKKTQAEEVLNNVHNIANKKEKRLSENEKDELMKFFEDYLGENKSQQNNKDKKYFKTILYLLKNAEKMIKDQEEDGQNPEKILPRYVPERMIMSYFIQYFSKREDIKNFYEEVKRIISPSSQVDHKRLKESSERLENINKILEKIKIEEDSPYKEELQENGDARIVQKSKGEGVKFLNKTFPDCADITVRHIMNLLIYNKENKWDDVVKEREEDYREILNAMKNDGQIVKAHTLKEKLKLFLCYQATHEKGADAVDIESRSFWNYVISNMDVNSDTEEGMYKIRYCKEGNELKTGFLNMLKLIYNMAVALKGESANSNSAKSEINKLEEVINGEVKSDLTDTLESAIKNTLGLINENIKISSLENIEAKSESRDCFGKVKINNFIVNQGNNHAYVTFNPKSLDRFKKSEGRLEAFLENDEVAQLLSKLFKINLGDDVKISTFNDLFCLKKGKCDASTQLYKNFKSLKFLKSMQGEEENYERIEYLINEHCGESNIDVTDRKGKNKVKVPFFIFKNYVKTKEQFEKLVPGQELDEFLKKNLSNNTFINKNKTKFYYAINGNSKGDKFKNITVWPLSMGTTEEVTIPSSLQIKGRGMCGVSNIGNLAFLNDDHLRKIRIEAEGGQHLIIGGGSFVGSSVEEIEISGNVEKLTIGKGAFENLDSLKSIKMSDSIKELNIGEDAFYGNSLSEFKVPLNVKKLTIGFSAFKGTTSLVSFKIPDGVEELNIGENSFKGTGLNIFEIPESVKELNIGWGAFRYTSLTKFKISNGVNELSIGEDAFKESCLKEFEIPENVKKLNIEDGSFLDVQSLTKFKMQDGIYELNIGIGAFEGTGLSEFEVPASIKNLNIEKNAFRDAKSLTSFKMPNSIENLCIGSGAFEDTSLREFEVPESVKKLDIGLGSFKNVELLTAFKIRNGVKELNIGEYAFYGTNLSKFETPESLEKLTIDWGAFIHLRPLRILKIPACVERINIGENAFYKTGISEFKLPKSVRKLTIGKSAFRSVKSLTSFNLPSNVEDLIIKNYAFSKSSLNELEIPKGVRNLTIDESAFHDTKSLTTFKVQEGIEKINIGKYAFYRTCISEFEIPESVKEITIGDFAFAETRLERLDVPDRISKKTVSNNAVCYLA